MPLKPGPVRDAYYRDYQRRKRAERKAIAERESLKSEYIPPSGVRAQVTALAEWARSLRCPPGHPRAGKPMAIPPYLLDYLTGALGARESLLSVARKNAKSSALALLALGYLCGPLRVNGWRGAVVSVNLDKSREFLRLAVDLAKANELPLKAYQKRIENRNTGAELECLPATSEAGHASGYDAVFLDELGLYPSKCRALIRGMYSSVTARDGKVFCISIRGDNEVLEEMIQRGGNRETYVQIHAADDGCSIQDESQWHRSNPGLECGIKSLSALRFAAGAVSSSPSDIAFFRSHELNQRLKPDTQVLVTVDDWMKCETDDLPDPVGRCYVGIDLGAVSSMSAVAAYYPDSGRLTGYGCFPANPSLRDRDRTDGTDGLYTALFREGTLGIHGDRIPDYTVFLGGFFSELPGEIAGIAFDRFRKPELEQILDGLGIHAPRFPRGTGASAKADGSHDVRAFQRAVLTGGIQVAESKLWRAGLRFAVLRHDEAGNPALDKSTRRGRIDIVSAGVLAVGLSQLDVRPEYRALRWA